MFKKASAYGLIWLLGLSFSFVYAQKPDKNINLIIEHLVEHLSEDDEATVRTEELIDHFYSLASRPVSVNDGSAEELKSLRLLNDFQIHSIIEYRKKNGDFQSIYELQLVFGFDPHLIKQLEPFITLKKSEKQDDFKQTFQHARHEFVTRYQRVIEEQNGYVHENDTTPSVYAGDASRQYYRYQVNAGDLLKAGFTLEKDPGEKLFPNKAHQGLDYNSGFIQFKTNRFLKQVNLIDYHANWGQGLVLWTGFGMGKSSYVTQTEKNAINLSKYSSTDENRFLRGVATTFDYKNFNLSVLYSHKKLDATVSNDSLHQGIRSFYETGLHQTTLADEKKDQVKEEVGGVRLDYKNSRFRLGLSAVHHQFGKPILSSDKLYKQFDFSGYRYQNAGFDYHYRLNKLVIYGEQAVSSNGGNAFLNAALVNVHPKLVLNIVHRSYSKAYHAHYSNAISESTKNKNEEGLYFGMELYPFPYIKISGYADTYAFPRPTFKCSSSSYGRDYLLQTEYTPGDNLHLRVLMKTESKLQDYDLEESKSDITSLHTTTKYRGDITYVLSSEFEIKNRIEFSNYKVETEISKGLLFYQDLRYKPRSLPFNIYLRYYIFNTDDYNSRIYVYENDVLYTFNVPALFDTGVRYYTMFKWKASQHISFWCRFSRTTYRARTSISSGDNEIQGNKKSEIKIQMRVKI